MPISDTSIFASLRISCKLIELVASAVPYIILGHDREREAGALRFSANQGTKKSTRCVWASRQPAREIGVLSGLGEPRELSSTELRYILAHTIRYRVPLCPTKAGKRPFHRLFRRPEGDRPAKKWVPPALKLG